MKKDSNQRNRTVVYSIIVDQSWTEETSSHKKRETKPIANDVRFDGYLLRYQVQYLLVLQRRGVRASRNRIYLTAYYRIDEQLEAARSGAHKYDTT